MKIAVIGAGSVGLAIAATAAAAGAETSIIARGASIEALRTKGIRVSGVLGDHAVSGETLTVLGPQDALPVCDVIVIATKATEVTAALEPYASAFATAQKSPLVLLVQNGWGSAQEVKQIVPPGVAVFSGSLMTGIERLSPVEAKIHAHGSPIRVGSLFGDDQVKAAPLLDLLAKGFFPFVHEPAIQDVLLKKLLFSICHNPLSGVLDATYAGLHANPQAVGLMEKLADESLKVIHAALGASLYKGGADYVRHDVMLKRVKNSPHRSSMLQDIEAGRKTEIAYICGAITKMGREHGLETPYNDMMAGLILALEPAAKA